MAGETGSHAETAEITLLDLDNADVQAILHELDGQSPTVEVTVGL